MKSSTTHRPLFWIAMALSLGIFANEHLPFSFKTLAVFTFLFLLSGLLTQKWKVASTFLVLISIIFLGAVFSKGHQALPEDHVYHIAKYYRKYPVRLEGIVVSDVEARDFFKGKKTTFILELKRFKTRWGWKERTGRVLVNIFGERDIRYGDYVVLEGKLHEPFEFSSEETFSYKEYLSRRKIKVLLSIKNQGYAGIVKRNQGNPFKAMSLHVKHRLSAILEESLSKNEAGIMQAVLLGERHHLPRHIKKICELCGVSHIFAISGLHLSAVAFLIFLFLKMLPIPRNGQYLLTMSLLIFYAFMTGGRPSVIRATIMINIFLVSFIIERETDSINTLSLAAIVILLLNPLNLFEVGFQLSFISVFSIIYFYPKLMKAFPKSWREEKPRAVQYLIQSFLVSLSAYLGVAGLIAYYFHIITPVAIAANLIVIPLITAIVALGMGLLLTGVVFPAAAFMFAACIKVLLNFMAGSIFLLAQIPGAYFQF